MAMFQSPVPEGLATRKGSAGRGKRPLEALANWTLPLSGFVGRATRSLWRPPLNADTLGGQCSRAPSWLRSENGFGNLKAEVSTHPR